MMWELLSILRSKKWKVGICSVLVFILTTLGVTSCLNYLYVDDTDEFARYMLHDFYEQEENVDRLYLGSSHVFCDINPVILDGINGENNYNLSTGSQQLITSYYLLKEADKKHDIKRVYLDLYYGCTTQGLGNFHSYEMLPYSWIVLNQMKPSVNKLSYILHLSEPKYYYMSFLAFTRYKEQLFHFDYITETVQKKQTELYRNYEYEHFRKVDGKEYAMRSAQKGFLTYDGVPEAGGFCDTIAEIPMQENPLTEESVEYLIKIVEYCKEQGIALTCIGCPISDYQLQANGTYDNYVSQVKRLAEEYDFAYYDFNLCKEEYLDLTDNGNWSDIGHLNTVGAEKFTTFLGNFLKAKETNDTVYEDCFYESFQEKMKQGQPRILGLKILSEGIVEDSTEDAAKGSVEEMQDKVRYQIYPVTNTDGQEIQIRAWKTSDNGKQELAVIYDNEGAYIELPVQEQGQLYVEAGVEGEVSNWAEVSY